MKAILALLLAAQPLIAATPPAEAPAPTGPRSPFEGLFVNWSGASKASIEAERRPDAAPAPDAPSAAQAGTRALGERVGEIVARGDCGDGERVARAAGDFVLVSAVRAYCTAPAPKPR
jgi:hypothetical protein